MNIEDDLKRLKESGISRTKAALALGMDKSKLDTIIEVLDMDWPKQVGGTYEINGLRRTLAAHAQALGLPPTTLRQRVKKGTDVTAPLRIAPVTREEAHAFAELRKAGVPAWEAAREMGRPYNTLKNAAKKFVPDYDQISANAPRIRRSPEEISLAS
ncbi:hypothetical protein IFT48_00765 [Pseudomonas fluorescens]|uniref:hypothetical protein n=1 Tax=Pseudomonas TaxID=286 RepID=UPI0013CE930C|nr:MULTISPECIES: hypothetical protein [Pseudomonas]MBD8088523.1 hypothetical protein [Pseudomonas fluorescens]MBD8615018.1 hypothetical protein [Pseudomonas putida]MBD8681299.1 hypothetical protein [Pseudomonas sp. CFBP 13719]